MEINLLDPHAFKSMKRFMGWREWIQQLWIPVLISVVIVLILVFGTASSNIPFYILGLGLVGVWLVTVISTFRKINELPNFETMYGSLVWTNGLPVTKQMVDKAQAHYLDKLVSLGLVNRDLLVRMYDFLRIEFERDLMNWRPGKLASGLAYIGTGYMRVTWKAHFDKNAFFHEQMHHTQYEVWGYRDSKHEVVRDWNLVSEMKKEYKP